MKSAGFFLRAPGLSIATVLEIAQAAHGSFLWVDEAIKRLPRFAEKGIRTLVVVPAERDRTPTEVEELLRDHDLVRPSLEDALLFATQFPFWHLTDMIVFPHHPPVNGKIVYLWGWKDGEHGKMTRRISLCGAEDPVSSQCWIAGIRPNKFA